MIEQSISDVNVISLNVNGMNNHIKRRLVFKTLRKYKRSVICLQETHIKSVELGWVRQLWGGEVAIAGESSQAGGLLILLTRDLEWRMSTLYADRLGHFLMVKVKCGDQALVVVNVYMPTADKELAQIQMLENIEGLLTAHLSENLLVMGDFNVSFDPKLDRHNYTLADIRNARFRAELTVFLNAFSLTDVWRVHHLGVKEFSWSRLDQASRLDYTFMSDNLVGQAFQSDYKDVAFSDHRLLLIQMGARSPPRGVGYWKLDAALLDNPDIFEDLVRLVEEKKVDYEGLDPALRWELLKFEIKTLFRGWATKLLKERNRLLSGLQNQITEIAEKEDLGPDELETLQNLKRELYAMEREAENKASVRARCTWAMYGGKPSKFFLNLEKRSFENKTISYLLDEQDCAITDPKAILDFEKSQFQKRYSKNVMDAHLPDPFSAIETNVISEEEAQKCDAELTIEELEIAMRSMANNKSPGCDGLTAEFYKRCWFLISDVLLDCFNAAYTRGSLTPNQRRGIISLIPKKGKDRRKLGNWRPIALLNLDYKILAKAIDNRISKVISSLIHVNQTGFMAKRFI